MNKPCFCDPIGKTECEILKEKLAIAVKALEYYEESLRYNGAGIAKRALEKIRGEK
jgi:hypothetical protein